MTNREQLNDLLADVFLLEPDEVNDGLRRVELDTWDSLGAVSLAVAVEETFGYHMKPEEAMALTSVGDIVALLEARGVPVHA
jgi:acyl carrier protein